MTKGMFTSLTMKSDHERWPFFFHGPIFMVQFLEKKNQFTKSFGPSLGVKPNVD